MNNVFSDTRINHQPGVALLADWSDIGGVLIGKVRKFVSAISQHVHDTKRYVDALPIGAEERRAVIWEKASRVVPRLDVQLKEHRL